MPPAWAEAPAKKFTKKARLQSLYEQLATPDQHDQMNRIRGVYNPRIEALAKQIEELKGQVKALENDRDDKIAAILSAGQKKRAEDIVKAQDAAAQAAKQAPAQVVLPQGR